MQLDEAQLGVIKKILKNEAPELTVWAFGSRVKGTAKPFSDLDLALIGNEKLDWQRIESLKDNFSASTLPFSVDIVDWHTITKDFQALITENHVEIQSAA